MATGSAASTAVRSWTRVLIFAPSLQGTGSARVEPISTGGRRDGAVDSFQAGLVLERPWKPFWVFIGKGVRDRYRSKDPTYALKFLSSPSLSSVQCSTWVHWDVQMRIHNQASDIHNRQRSRHHCNAGINNVIQPFCHSLNTNLNLKLTRQRISGIAS
jgi:hypothetical protein